MSRYAPSIALSVAPALAFYTAEGLEPRPFHRRYGGSGFGSPIMSYNATTSSRVHGRSLYAAFASFAVACFVLACATDFAYWLTASVLWETMSAWLLAAGLVVGGMAIVAGIVDLIRSRRVSGLRQSPLMVLGQAVAFGLSLINMLVHSRDGYTAVVPQGVALSCLVVLILLGSTIFGRARAPNRYRGDQA